MSVISSRDASRTSRAGQLSIEFVILMGAFFIVFFALLIVLQERGTDIYKDNQRRAAIAAADVVVREVRYAYTAGDGYERSFSMPFTLVGFYYNMSVIQGDNASVLLFRFKNTTTTPVSLPLPLRIDPVVIICNPPGSHCDIEVENTVGRVQLRIPDWLS